MELTKTELHTHLMGMLPVTEFLEFIKSFGFNEVTFPLNDKEMLIDDLIDNPRLLNYLFIPGWEQVDYFQLNTLYSYRTLLIKELISKYKEREGISYKMAEKVIMNSFINACLRDLVNHGIKYVEISYSFTSRINNFVIDDDLVDKIKCKFLLSTSRTNPCYKDASVSNNSFEASAKDLVKVLKGGNGVGFDIMGEEIPMTLDELDPSNRLHSFKKKLELLFDVLFKYPDTTLRIHSGETPKSFNNTNYVLKMIDEISTEKGIKIPPPEIRIGHGLYFVDTPEYVDLLKKFECIIEINASSNFALSNVKSYGEIPYQYYYDNGIPIVIATDGRGLYDTNVEIEDVIANSVIDDTVYDSIVKFDDDYNAGRGL